MSRPGRMAAAVGVGAVLMGSLMVRARTGSPIEALRAARDWFLMTGTYGPPAAATPKPDPPPLKRRAARRDAGTPTRLAQRTDVPAQQEPAPESARPADPVASAAAAASPGASAPAPEPPVVAAPVAPRRAVFYLPGQRSEWVVADLALDGPRVIRSAGRISLGGDVSNPNGLRDSNYERSIARRSRTAVHERQVPSAPYLALIGRVCSARNCSKPFFVGTKALVCPSDSVPGPVALQLWTNNYVVVDGAPTTRRFLDVVGGFSVYAEAAPPDACAGRSASRAATHELTPMVAEEVLRGPGLRVSSNQTWWKPFFVPLGQPLLIRASGKVHPRASAAATGPEGIGVPDVPRWLYPGTSDVVVDSGRKLYDRAFPYQALIGRLCGTDECGPAFLVGGERAVCARAPYDDHLELWINHIVGADGRPKGATALATDTFELLEGRRGEYRLEFSRAPAGACGVSFTTPDQDLRNLPQHAHGGSRPVSLGRTSLGPTGPRRSGGAVDAPREHETLGPELVVDVVASNPAGATAGVDHHAVTLIDPDVCHERPPGVFREEHEISPLQPSPADGLAGARLIDRPTREVDADSPEDVLHEAGAVERIGPFGAPDVRASDEVRRELDRFRDRFRGEREAGAEQSEQCCQRESCRHGESPSGQVLWRVATPWKAKRTPESKREKMRRAPRTAGCAVTRGRRGAHADGQCSAAAT